MRFHLSEHTIIPLHAAVFWNHLSLERDFWRRCLKRANINCEHPCSRRNKGLEKSGGSQTQCVLLSQVAFSKLAIGMTFGNCLCFCGSSGKGIQKKSAQLYCGIQTKFAQRNGLCFGVLVRKCFCEWQVFGATAIVIRQKIVSQKAQKLGRKKAFLPKAASEYCRISP